MSIFDITPENLDAIDVADPYDVCIIGSGPAGTVLGASLAKRDLKVIVLESGTNLLRWMLDTRLHNLAAYTFSGDTDYPLTKTKARLLGGNSNFWTGRCERLHPSDFEEHPYTPPDNPWPITYDDLNPYYHQAEKTLRVRGGIRSKEAPPRDDAGQPLIPPGADISYLKNLFGRAGISVDYSPTATPSKTFRFFNVQKELLPELTRSGNGVAVSGVIVTKLRCSKDGQITGAEVMTIRGIVKEVRARRYVVACGGMESPRLLLLSACEAFPDGIGNHSSMVGCGFNEHPAVNFYARINHSAETLKPTNKLGRSHQYYTRYRREGLGSVLLVFRQAWLLPHHVMPHRLSAMPEKMLSAMYRVVKPTIYMGATVEQCIDMNNRVNLSKERKDCFGNPAAHLNFNYSQKDLLLLERCRQLCREVLEKVGAVDILEAEVTWSRHHQGTCRMGNNPETSVVDKNLKVHGCSNLYVAGSETFVTGGAMQPALTITALSHRLVDHLSAHN